MAIQSAAGTATPTPYAERLMGMLQFRKGAHFIGAALLLRQHGGEEYVVLHNLCQGLELIIKGLLLVKDFDSYRPKLGGRGAKGQSYGHDLMRLATDALAEFKLNPLRPPLIQELTELNRWFSNHALRYGLLETVFIDASAIQSGLVLRRLGAVLRLVEREHKRSGG